MDFDDNGRCAWEDNARFWDEQMGDESNFFHRDIVRPNVEKLLEVNGNDFVLDGFYEVPFEGETAPIIMTVRLRKL